MVRKKNRYLLAEVLFESGKQAPSNLNEPEFYKEIRDALQIGFGDYGLGLVKKSLNVRYFMEDTCMLLVRIRRGAESMLSNVFLTVKSVCGVPVTIVTKHISGSIRCAQKYWIKYSRRKLGSTLRSITDPEEKTALRQKLDEINKTDFSDLLIIKQPIPSPRLAIKQTLALVKLKIKVVAFSKRLVKWLPPVTYNQHMFIAKLIVCIDVFLFVI
ncbi:POP5 [Bugula neritina]|uniref:POP5 n=1 Tax=Bugula neritina TaxID=10212 RepID=A0A7J7JV80_BUGNE|nr:POP5 [Bugula neritina]